ncbi:MAG: periplasmic heavy metal sensor [Planctomycetota bacterium]
MRRKLVLIILALSLALNAAFTITCAVQRFARHVLSAKSGRPVAGSDEGIWSPLHRRLNVTEEQWRKIEPHVREFLRRMEQRHERISEMRREMLDVLFSPDIDREAIEEQQHEVLKAFRRTQNVVLDHVLTERQYLTDTQEKKLKGMLQQGMMDSRPCRPPGSKGGPGVGKAFRELEKDSRGR